MAAGFKMADGVQGLEASGNSLREVIHSCVDQLLGQLEGEAAGVSGEFTFPCSDPFCTDTHRIWVAIAEVTGKTACATCSNTGWVCEDESHGH